VTLLDARLNDTHKIIGIKKDADCDDSIARRLLDMGFTKGTQIKIAAIAPFGGTVLVSMRGGMVALRENAASLILLDNKVDGIDGGTVCQKRDLSNATGGRQCVK